MERIETRDWPPEQQDYCTWMYSTGWRPQAGTHVSHVLYPIQSRPKVEAIS